MRFFLNLFLICTVTVAFAQQDTLPSQPRQHELHFGVNLTRLIVKDYELQVFYKVDNRSIVGISGGYDFNRGEELFTDTPVADDTTGWHATDSHTYEGETRETSRYFFGKGPVFRLSLDYLWLYKQQRQKLLTVEALCKIRNYENYYYQDNRLIFLESATQKIFGLSILFGRFTEIENFISLKVFGGFGFRYLQSDVVRPGYFYFTNSWHPEERFRYHFWFPTGNLGLSMIINPAGTGAPKIAE